MNTRSRRSLLLLTAVAALIGRYDESTAQPTIPTRTAEIRQTTPNLGGQRARVPVSLPDRTFLGSGFTNVFWSPDLNEVALGGQTSSIYSFTTRSTALTLPATPRSWSNDGNKLLLEAAGDSMLVWNLASRTTRVSLVKKGALASFNRDDSKVVAGPDRKSIHPGGTTRVWSVATGQEIFRLGAVGNQNFNDNNQQINVDVTSNPEFSPNGSKLLLLRASGSASTSSSPGSGVEIYDATSWQRTAAFGLTGSDGVNIAHWSPDNSKVLVAGSNVEIHNASTGALIRKIEIGNRITSAEWNHNGSQIVTATHNAKYQIWDASTGSLLKTLESPSVSTSDQYTASFSPDGRKVATILDKKVKVWDAATGSLLQTFDHIRIVKSALWRPSSDGMLTLNGSDAIVWKVN